MTAIRFPKPVPRVRKPKRLQRRRPIWDTKKSRKRPESGARDGMVRRRTSSLHPSPGSGRARGKRKTKHGRRVRLSARMLFLRSQPCRVIEIWALVCDTMGFDRRAMPAPPPCDGVIEVMHLGSKRKNGGWRRADDDTTARGCKNQHADVDGDVGGHGDWYMALGEDGQRRFRDELIAVSTQAWDALSDGERLWWAVRAETEAAIWKAARRLARAEGIGL